MNVVELSSDEEDKDDFMGSYTDLLLVDQIPTVEQQEILADVKEAKMFLIPPPGCHALQLPRADILPMPLVKQEEPPLQSVPPESSSALPPPRLCRQFWKSGDYEVGHGVTTITQNGRNRLRINPRFLHSNATSHKWAFGAIAELLDNAIDEVHSGATFVRVNKFTNPRDGTPALLIQDDGGGMDPESLRRCISFGFSDKQSDAYIGQYGNGFKTSTMRLGADVIVFTRSEKNWTTTKSVGLLSYTFLRQTGADDIVVPTVDYEFDVATRSFSKMLRHDVKQFSSNLTTLLRWSPFATEADLDKQFDDMGDHGTKIIIFNLWLNDDGNMELDFNSAEKDILITGVLKTVKTKNTEKLLTRNYIASRLRHSLRAYASVLYLHVPDTFRIILRGQVVEPHRIANDLMFCECVLYRPQVGGIPESAVVTTTIGFVKGAPDVDVQGFNVYHKNRLILPFWKVASNSYGKGRGVVGILETNFIKPTHDKQDFEKSTLYQKLENRLKEMTYEYWDLHCHLIGYDNKKLPKLPGIARTKQTKMDTIAPDSPLQLPASDRILPNLKRKHEFLSASKAADKPATHDINGAENSAKIENLRGAKQKRFHELTKLTLENKKLHEQCKQYEESEKEVVLKEQMLRTELAEAQKVYERLLAEFESMEVKPEKL